MELRFRNKYSTTPYDVRAHDAFAVKVVAVAGVANDWAAYVGPSTWTATQVAEQGSKLTKAQAGDLFYCMCTRTYRE